MRFFNVFGTRKWYIPDQMYQKHVKQPHFHLQFVLLFVHIARADSWKMTIFIAMNEYDRKIKCHRYFRDEIKSMIFDAYNWEKSVLNIHLTTNISINVNQKFFFLISIKKTLKHPSLWQNFMIIDQNFPSCKLSLEYWTVSISEWWMISTRF
jgi:hypothetical protein